MVSFDRFTSSNGLPWRLEDAGSGLPIVAVHGVGGGAFFFRGLASRLGPGFRVLAVDLPSARDNADGQALTMQAWVQGLHELIAARFGGPVAFVGHSLGTIVGLELWRRWPGDVARFVFAGGLPEVRPVVRERLQARIDAIAAEGIEGWGTRVAPGVFGSRALRDQPEVVGLFERLFDAQAAAGYIRSVQLLLEASAVDVVPTVTVPCLSISGSEEAYAPPDAVAAFLARLPAPCRQVILDGVGHMPFYEQPVEFAAAVRAFVGEMNRDV